MRGPTGVKGTTGAKGATGPAGTTAAYRAGTATIAAGSSTVTVTMSSAMPSTNYTVAVTLNGQGASAWGPGAGGSSAQCVAFDAAVISTTQFSITFRLCGTGAATTVNPNAAHLGWIAIQNN